MKNTINKIFLILFTAILFISCNNLEKSKTEEKYKQIRMAEGLAKELNKNPELIDILDTQELKGKTEEEIINAKASAINKIYNDYLKEHGYKGKPIVTIVTDVTDPNGNFYMNEDTNEMVVDKQTLLKMTKDDALYNIGHEFGHYSVADDKATKDQMVGKFVGNYVKEKTKELKPEKATKDTWEKLSNNSNLITGAEAKKRAEAIPMENREYLNKKRFIEGAVETGISGLRVVQGLGEISTGAGIVGTGIGTVPGGILLVHGGTELILGANDSASGLHKIYLAILDKDDETAKNYLREKFGEGYEALNMASASSNTYTQEVKNTYGGVSKINNKIHVKKDIVRVGRWMSKEEYNKMIKTGKVQMSQADITHVAKPADINAFKGAKKGSVYVEFDVKTEVISPGGNENWGIISGPNSIRNRYYKQKGLPTIDEIPNAHNIEVKGRK